MEAEIQFVIQSQKLKRSIENYGKMQKMWNLLINKLNEDGILWVISEDSFDNKSIPKTFQVIEELTSKGLILKNFIFLG